MHPNGAKIVMACLKAQGVDTIFGFPGGAVIPLYDALYDEVDHLKHYRTCHEQGAVHAADGYARTTGKVGVCIVTSGPGATNTVTGIATAYLDSIPLVIITGQVATPLIGRDSFQEVDITAMTLTITKHCEMVKNIESLESTVMRAFEIARAGRPGPVLIDIPKDIFMQTCEYKGIARMDSGLGQNSDLKAGALAVHLDAAVQALKASRNPVILVGGGVVHSNASEKLVAFATRCNIPVANTLMGSGVFPQSHELALGLIGMHGSVIANNYLSNADLVLVVGVRFSDRVIGATDKFCASAKIIQIEIDVNEVNKNKEILIPLIGDIPVILEHLSIALSENRWVFTAFQTLEQHENVSENPENDDENLKPKPLLERLKKHFGEDTIVVTEVGQHQMWTAQNFGFEKPRTFITSGGLGTMGFGLCAAIGAKIGNPTRPVIHIAGDGSFKMNCNELGTVSKYQIPIITFIFNNHALGMVRQWQRLFCSGRFSETDGDDSVDFVKLAEAYGIDGYRVRTLLELDGVLEKIKDQTGPIVVDCILDHDENVYPIIPPGNGLTEMVIGR